MADAIYLSQIRDARKEQGLPHDDAALAGVRDAYLEALKGGKTQSVLVDDTAGDNVFWVVKDHPEQGPMWQPVEEPLEEDLLNDVIANLSFGTLARPSSEGSLPGRVAGLASMIGTAGGLGGALGTGRGLLGRVLGQSAAFGTHSGSMAATGGGSPADVAKAAGTGAAIGGGLSALGAIPGAAGQLGSAGGLALSGAAMEAAMNPQAEWDDYLGSALTMLLAGKAMGFPYRTRYEPVGAPRQEIAGLLPAGPEPVRGPTPMPPESAAAIARGRRTAPQGQPASTMEPGLDPNLRIKRTKSGKVEILRARGKPVRDKRGNVKGYEIVEEKVLPREANPPVGDARMPGKLGRLRGYEDTGASPVAPMGREMPAGGGEPVDALQSGQGESATAKAEYRNQKALERAKELYDRAFELTGSKEDAMQAASTFLSRARDSVREANALELEFRKRYWNEPGEPEMGMEVKGEATVAPPEQIVSNIDDLGSGPVVEQAGQVREVKPAEAQAPAPSPEQGKDITLGSGLGGAQGVLEEAFKYDLPKMQVVKGSGIDRGAYEYRKTGNIDDWIKYSTADKNQVTQSFKDEVAGYERDVWAGEYDLSGRKFALPAVGQGTFGSAIDKFVLWPDYNAEMAAKDFARKQTAAGADAVGTLSKRAAEDLTVRAEKRENRSDADVVAVRKWFDELWGTRNRARAARGEKPIDYITDYVTHMQKLSAIEKLRAEGDVTGTGTRGKKAKKKIVSQFARQRTGKTEKREMDIRKLMDAYLRDSVQDIFAKPVHNKNEAVAKALEEAGLDGSAELILKYSNRTFAGEPHGITEWFGKTPIARDIAPPMKWLRRRLTDSALVLNMAWMVGVQGASTSALLLHASPLNAARAIPLAFDPTFRRFVFTRLRGGYEKNMSSLGAAAQEAGPAMHGIAPKGKYDTVRDYANFLSHEYEKSLYTHAAGAAMFEGRARGYSGRKLIEFMGDVASKVHSDYNRESRAGLQQSGEFTSAFPFMTWVIDNINSHRQNWGGRYRTGYYKNAEKGSPARTIAERTKRTLGFIAFLAMWDEFVSGPLIGRRLLRDMIFGEEPSPMMPAAFAADLGRSIAYSVSRGSVEPLAKFATQRLGLAGGQIHKVWSTYEATQNDGEVMSRSGKSELFNISGEEPKSYLLGPWSTTGGQEKSEDYYDAPLWDVWEAVSDKFYGVKEEKKKVRRR